MSKISNILGRLSDLALITALFAVAAAAQSGQPMPQDRIAMQLFSARVKQAAGEYSAARGVLIRAVSEAPESAPLLNALGSVEQDLGEYFEAEDAYLHALDASARTVGDSERLSILNNLGTLYLDTDQCTKAERVLEQLRQLRPGALESHPSEAATLLDVIGSLEHARNRDSEAERYYARSLQLFHQTQGAVSAGAAAVESNLGFLRLELGQYESAKDLFRQSIHDFEVALGPDGPALIRPLVNLARCENMSGHPNEAEPLARRAVELSRKVFGEAHQITATAQLEQASAPSEHCGARERLETWKSVRKPRCEPVPAQILPATQSVFENCEPPNTK
jgi:tetratricopeptide (TPR) repeat protein